jgi:catechol 2,3-dioxygenase-like lactoylglutathione lyase family enzyme
VPVAAGFVRASVPDLARSAAYFTETVGLERHDPALLHRPEHEALWGLDGAVRRVELLAAGDLWLELVQYEDPVPAPWPDGYRISDLGILNVALGSRDKEEYAAVRDAVRASGSRINAENDVGYGSFLYSVDDQGFSLELIYLDPAADAGTGFLPV